MSMLKVDNKKLIKKYPRLERAGRTCRDKVVMPTSLIMTTRGFCVVVTITMAIRTVIMIFVPLLDYNI